MRRARLHRRVDSGSRHVRVVSTEHRRGRGKVRALLTTLIARTLLRGSGLDRHQPAHGCNAEPHDRSKIIQHLELHALGNNDGITRFQGDVLLEVFALGHFLVVEAQARGI